MSDYHKHQWGGPKLLIFYKGQVVATMQRCDICNVRSAKLTPEGEELNRSGVGISEMIPWLGKDEFKSQGFGFEGEDNASR